MFCEGSCARNEDTPMSDIDMPVQFIPEAKISLFDYGGIVHQLEETTGRKVDLVQEGMLKSFARESVEKDKILIYERNTLMCKEAYYAKLDRSIQEAKEGKTYVKLPNESLSEFLRRTE